MRRTAQLLILLAVTCLGASAAPIHDAAESGSLLKIRQLLEKDPSLLNLRDEKGRTPLHRACRGSQSETVAFLLHRGADVTARENGGCAPLHLSSAVDDKASMRLLLEKGSDPNARDLEGRSPLNLAAASGALSAVRLLVEKKADLESRDSRGRTPLITAARERGGVAVVRALLDAGANIDAVDAGDDSALQLAAWRGYADVVDLLLDRGARVPVEGPDARQLLTYAASKGLDRLFLDMVRKGADLSAAADQSSLLHAGAAGGSVGILRVLVEKGQDVNSPDDDGWTPLMFAADMGRPEAAAFLLSRGAEANARNFMGQSAWNIASENGERGIAELLASKGADAAPPKFPSLSGPYLGQKPPGKTPQLYARGIVSGRYHLHSCIAFSPDGKEAAWSLMIPARSGGYSSDRTLVTRLVDGRWTYPRHAVFGAVEVDDVPTYGPGGKKLYDMAERPLPGIAATGREHIWAWERSGTEWANPAPVQGAVNEVPLHWQFGVDRSENLYVSTNIAGGRGGDDLYRSRPKAGLYSDLENLGDDINTPANEFTPFVSADGRVLIFSRDGDLYASFPGKDGKWRPAEPLGGGVNTPANELCPVLSPDGKYLFFLRGWAVYWVDAAVVEEVARRGDIDGAAGEVPAKFR